MKNILFVCLGNICRSPMAEGIFRDIVHKRGLDELFTCDSAGTAGYHIGRKPDNRTLAICENHGINLQHVVRQFKKEDFNDYDVILAMDRANLKNIKILAPDETALKKVGLIRRYDTIAAPDSEVPDPYYGNLRDFEEVYHMLHRSCMSLVDYLVQNKK